MKAVIKTDQIQCYDVDGRLMDCAGTGLDGEMRCGANWPIPRFEQREGVSIAWVVYMQDGAVGVGYKKNADFHVWAVRGGIRLQDLATRSAGSRILV